MWCVIGLRVGSLWYSNNLKGENLNGFKRIISGGRAGERECKSAVVQNESGSCG